VNKIRLRTPLVHSRGVLEQEYRSRLRQELVFFNRIGAGSGLDIFDWNRTRGRSRSDF